jgi:hypothetical protein
MKRSLWILRLVWIGAMSVTGCGGGPTAPPPDGDGGGPPAEVNLTGNWTGTVTDLLGSCQPESFSVALQQGEIEPYFKGQSAKVDGTFSTPCQGSFAIHGSLVGGGLYGSIFGKGRITGSATTNAIHMTILEGSGGLEGGQKVVCRLAMQR